MYPGLRYTHKKLNFAGKNFFEKCLFEYTTRFAVKKAKKDFGANSKLLGKIFFLAIKK